MSNFGLPYDALDFPTYLSFIIKNAKELNSGNFYNIKDKTPKFNLKIYNISDTYADLNVNFNDEQARFPINLKRKNIGVQINSSILFKKIIDLNIFQQWYKYIKLRILYTYNINRLPKKTQEYIEVFKKICYSRDFFGFRSVVGKNYSYDICSSRDKTNNIIEFDKNKDLRDSSNSIPFIIIKHKTIEVQKNILKNNSLNYFLKKEIFKNLYS